MGTDFRVGAWLVRPSLNTVSRDGASVHLQPKVMEVLVTLALQPGEAVPKDQLLKTVWPDTFVTDDVLIRSISELRRIFEDDAREPRIIETIPKRGYRLVAPVAPANGATDTSTALEGSRAGSAAGKSTRNLWRVGAFASAALLLVVLIAGWGKLQRWLSAGSGAPAIHSIAVLPLQNLSGDPAQEYFSDGMTDALITDLAQIGSLKVISRTSSMQYKQTKKSMPEIAHELNVDGIIEGTVQRSGDRVRITAQLVQGPSDKHLWATSYERDLRDVFALEREVTDDIARQVRARLTTPKPTPPAHSRPVNPIALDAYLQGNYYLSKWGTGLADEELRQAARYFQQAIDADPEFAPAYVGMAEAHNNLMRGSSEDLAIVESSAQKAVELDPNSPDAHETLGWIKFHHFWDWAGAGEEFRAAISLNPNSADGHRSLCSLLGSLGRMDEALKECQVAQELDPNQDHLTDILYFRRECDRGIELALRWIDRYPDNAIEHIELFHCYVLKGMHKEAIQELERMVVLFGSKEAAAHIHQGFAISGYGGAMLAWAKEIEHLDSTKEAFLPLNAAQAYAELGDKDHAFYWLEQAYQRRDLVSVDDGLVDLKTDPMLEPLRSDARYKDLLSRVGLSQ